MSPVYAVGDLHGRQDQLERVLDLIEADGGQDAEIVFLGDYIDRGPDSRSVIETLSQGVKQGRNWICLKGNHDRMFQWFMEDVPRHDPHMLVGYHWLHEVIGGIETLASYDVHFEERTRLNVVHEMAKALVPQTHVDFLNGLELTHMAGSVLFVHAGIRPRVPLDQQTEEDLVWIRNSFHDHTEPHEFLVVHGHTPVKRPMHYGNRINLDTGAGYGNEATVAVLEGPDAWVLSKKGRTALQR